jgi:aminopeptidase N
MAVCLVLAACSVDRSVIATQSNAPTVDTQPDTAEPGSGAPAVTLPDTTEPTDPTQPTEPTEPIEPTEPTGDEPVATLPSPDEVGADGVGDPLFPELGNPGIDVTDYDVQLNWDTDNDVLGGSVALSITPTQDRAEFTLDSSGPQIDRVTVDGVEAEFDMDDPELRITPVHPLVTGVPVVVLVEYTAKPYAKGTGADLPSGWFNTPGGSYVLNEPDGARRWLPSNDHPSDKATWTVAITVADGITVVSNGVLVSTTDDAVGGTTFVWRQDVPMTTYLVQLLTGDYTLVEGTGPDGLPLSSAVLTDDLATMQPYIDSIDDQIDFFDDYFGAYPLQTYGVAITDSFAGLAMETQGRSMFSRDDLNGDEGYIQQLLLSHELAHQWFGDAVSPAEWQDIWLNESFATYAEWMWLEHVGLSDVAGEAAQALQDRSMSKGSATGTPTVGELFGFNSYDGGAVVLHALRQTIGDDPFFLLLQRWSHENLGTSRTSEDFIALAEQVSGDDLTEFFDTWLYAQDLPAGFPVAK